MEWIPGPEGYINWLYDGEFVWGMDSKSFGAYEVCSTTAAGKSCKRTPPRMIPQVTTRQPARCLPVALVACARCLKLPAHSASCFISAPQQPTLACIASLPEPVPARDQLIVAQATPPPRLPAPPRLTGADVARDEHGDRHVERRQVRAGR